MFRGWSWRGLDCNDDDATIYPGARTRLIFNCALTFLSHKVAAQLHTALMLITTATASLALPPMAHHGSPSSAMCLSTAMLSLVTLHLRYVHEQPPAYQAHFEALPPSTPMAQWLPHQ